MILFDASMILYIGYAYTLYFLQMAVHCCENINCENFTWCFQINLPLSQFYTRYIVDYDSVLPTCSVILMLIVILFDHSNNIMVLQTRLRIKLLL